MNRSTLTVEEILQGYDAVCSLYPHFPTLSHWRAWEYAAYRRYPLHGRVLDLGCGDGQYFRLIWPRVTDAVGVDMHPESAEAARQSGVYRAVHVAAAHRVPEAGGTFDHVFANCSLEHMEQLDAVVVEINRCLRPGGTLLCSVVTERFNEWAVLPKLVAMAGFGEAAAGLQRDFVAYHHLVNPLPVGEWQRRFALAGLVPQEHIPILPKFNTGFFLLLDALWHIRRAGGGEIGDTLHALLGANPNFPRAFRSVVAGLLEMETDWEDCGGAVFQARKPG